MQLGMMLCKLHIFIEWLNARGCVHVTRTTADLRADGVLLKRFDSSLAPHGHRQEREQNQYHLCRDAEQNRERLHLVGLLL